MMKLFRKKDKGFSLVELMIVVAIIAILAAIAIPAFMRFAMKSKTSEATGNLSAIRTAEESYKAENDVYYNCLQSPAALTGSTPQAWVEAGLPSVNQFADIGFEPDGWVRYQYQVINASPVSFAAEAAGDLDDDALAATFTITKGAPGYPKPVKGVPPADDW